MKKTGPTKGRYWRTVPINSSLRNPIMRTFIKLRSFLAMEGTLADKVGRLEKSTNHLFKIVFERLDSLEEAELPKYEHPHDRKRIGLKSKGN